MNSENLEIDQRLTEKYGEAERLQLSDGRIRYYGNIEPARKIGEMVGRRLVREWNPATNKMRTWHETLDGNGRIRQVRPSLGRRKIHYMFDEEGNYCGAW